MATVEQRSDVTENGTKSGIPVENPATGEVITTVPDLSADEVKKIAAKAREAQPAWEAMGFEERGKVLLRAQKWATDNAERIIDAIFSETGKTYEDAPARRGHLCRQRLRLLGQEGARVPGRREGEVEPTCSSRAASSSCATGRSAWSGSSARGTTR